ncbi:hypothetical protein SDRG_13340 [Saprolegnia diclina VS20]|uniref:Chitin-binding type-4 domain-containing protein n=1 Tax=Saprolegnia diclina (strain VS20) TaxID=1156394 RepID=T0Q6E0_SAPDV|nr:hypothetical protein SDRG_13340 [Saprolegnia diclina VS20]EQC29005.1 hypothetical protein SDRG_13340 [Saprolegnia diclina VS20]|eukprot:XP_008617644.1 hypothetical protein SDRG_13340 [Saprolegnia diclina VS20]
MVRQLFLLLGAVAAHSWIECSDYLMTSVEDRNYWDASKCFGYPRCSAARNGVFGNEGSLDYQSAKGNSCQCAQGSNNAYTSTYPKATYVPGQRVCLAYPAKNHVADHCTNQYIPDNGMTIYRSTVGATADPALGQWPVQYPNTTNGEHANGVIDYKGFQNCPKFCENMPNAFCSLCFDLEPDLALGTYTFHWEWLFNANQAKYISCWEADVVQSKSHPTPSFLPSTTAAPQPLSPPGSTPAPMPYPSVTPSVQPTPAPTNKYGPSGTGSDYFDCD